MSLPRILLIDGAEREPWYASLRRTVDAHWMCGALAKLIDRPGNQVDLAVVSDERALPYAVDAVCRLARHNIPTLHLLDGILEWRNTWENPTFTLGDQPATPFLQPSMCHKIACLGRSQARVLESWGNLGKCEVVGLPRLDDFVRKTRPTDSDRSEFRLLVVTARTAGFTPEQMDAVERSLVDLKQWLAAHPTIDNRPVHTAWRLTGDLAGRVGVDNRSGNVFGNELAESLGQFDAMITTPSTAQLEGMLAGLPVALLDYHNRPHYVPAAWTLSAPTHFDQILPALAKPDAAHMLHQETILHDALECHTPAGPRLVQLIDEMVRQGRQCRGDGQMLQLPQRILTDTQDGHHLPELRFDYGELYPDHPVFSQTDRTELQMEIAHLRRVLARQGVLETHPVWGPALRIRRRVKNLLGQIRPRGRDA